MNENRKTFAFIAVAAGMVLIALISQPHQWSDKGTKKIIGENLTKDFDPLSVSGMEIVEYDEATATLLPFQVALVDIGGKRRWSIPSHYNYPADADRQVAGAATALMGLKILSVEGDTKADREKFGVVDPNPKTLKVGETGVGMKVALRDKDNKDLVSLIIGKEVPGRPGLRYVRRPGQDPIYTVAINTENLSTKFDHWIEKNLLQLKPWNIRKIWLRDYSTALMLNRQGRLGVEKQNHGEIVLQYDSQAEPHWRLLEDRIVNEDGTLSPNKTSPEEELNISKLDEMKNALNDLKIVNVARKPKGLSADLKASADFTKNKESLMTLASCGFIVALSGNQAELYSKEGEVRVLMKDGVEYVLRFGDMASESGMSNKNTEKEHPKKGGKKPAEKSLAAGLNRYLSVMAEFNPEAIEKPKLTPLPELKPEARKKAEAEPQSEKTEAKSKSEQEKQPTDAKTDKSEQSAKAGHDETKAEKAKADALQAARKLVEKENKRRQDEYDEKIASGKKHVAELNARFADWYYIISNDVYRQIHLCRAEIIKKKEKKDEAEQQPDSLPPLPAGAMKKLEKLPQEAAKEK
ncbi:MAG: DUF4340 domain-containing protein [Thermoguttaceae bacterium]